MVPALRMRIPRQKKRAGRRVRQIDLFHAAFQGEPALPQVLLAEATSRSRGRSPRFVGNPEWIAADSTGCQWPWATGTSRWSLAVNIDCLSTEVALRDGPCIPGGSPGSSHTTPQSLTLADEAEIFEYTIELKCGTTESTRIAMWGPVSPIGKVPMWPYFCIVRI